VGVGRFLLGTDPSSNARPIEEGPLFMNTPCEPFARQTRTTHTLLSRQYSAVLSGDRVLLPWGILSCVNDILIIQFMKSVEITRSRAGLIQSPFYMGYFPPRHARRLGHAQSQLQDRVGDPTSAPGFDLATL